MILSSVTQVNIRPRGQTLNSMSSSQNLQPENAGKAEDAEDVSIPTLSSDFILFKALKFSNADKILK